MGKVGSSDKRQGDLIGFQVSNLSLKGRQQTRSVGGKWAAGRSTCCSFQPYDLSPVRRGEKSGALCICNTKEIERKGEVLGSWARDGVEARSSCTSARQLMSKEKNCGPGFPGRKGGRDFHTWVRRVSPIGFHFPGHCVGFSEQLTAQSVWSCV